MERSYEACVELDQSLVEKLSYLHALTSLSADELKELCQEEVDEPQLLEKKSKDADILAGRLGYQIIYSIARNLPEFVGRPVQLRVILEDKQESLER